MFLYPAIPTASQHYNFRCAVSKFTPRIDQLVQSEQKQKSH